MSTELYMRAASRAALTGEPFKSLVEAVREQSAVEVAARVVDLEAARARLRPANPMGPAAA